MTEKAKTIVRRYVAVGITAIALSLSERIRPSRMDQTPSHTAIRRSDWGLPGSEQVGFVNPVTH
jgi:hypothetical protein